MNRSNKYQLAERNSFKLFAIERAQATLKGRMHWKHTCTLVRQHSNNLGIRNRVLFILLPNKKKNMLRGRRYTSWSVLNPLPQIFHPQQRTHRTMAKTSLGCASGRKQSFRYICHSQTLLLSVRVWLAEMHAAVCETGKQAVTRTKHKENCGRSENTNPQCEWTETGQEMTPQRPYSLQKTYTTAVALYHYRIAH